MIRLSSFVLALACVTPAFAAETVTSTAPATTAAAEAPGLKAPKEVIELLTKLEALAKEGKWDEVITLAAPPAAIKDMGPEEMKEIKQELAKDNAFLKAIQAALKAEPKKVSATNVEYKLGDDIDPISLEKIDGRWYLK